ncbi:unnamed protein product [Ixodes pacificus]
MRPAGLLWISLLCAKCDLQHADCQDHGYSFGSAYTPVIFLCCGHTCDH